MKHGKKYNAAAAKYDLAKKYDIATAQLVTYSGITTLEDVMANVK